MSAEPYAEEMVCCVIDPETRVIDVPAEYQLLGVESDEKVERMYFQCPKIVGDNIDLSKLALRVNFRNANDQKDQYIVDDVEISGDNITFSWLLSRRVTQYKGNVSFIVCAVKASGEEITNEWNTTLATAQVLEGLEADITLPDEDTDSFVLLQRFCRKCFTRWIYFKLSGKVLAKLCFAELSSHLKSIKNRFNGKRKRLKTETSHERA